MQFHNISSNEQCIMSFLCKHKMVCRTIRSSLCNITYDDEITHVTSGEISHNMLYNDYAYYFYSRDYVTKIRFVMCRICGEYKNKQKMEQLNFSLVSNTRMLCKCNGDLYLEDNTNYNIYTPLNIDYDTNPDTHMPLDTDTDTDTDIPLELDYDTAFLDNDETFLDIVDETFLDIVDEFDENGNSNYCMLF